VKPGIHLGDFTLGLGFLAGRTERIKLGLLVTGVTYRTPGCWRRPSPHWTCCRAAAPCSGSGPPDTSVSTSASACRFPRWRNDSSAWRRRSRSCFRCGATTTAHTRGANISSLVLGTNPAADADGFLSAMERYARIGVNLVEIPPMGPDPAAMVTRVCELVVPRLAELGADRR
jgi:hypothetical protein